MASIFQSPMFSDTDDSWDHGSTSDWTGRKTYQKKTKIPNTKKIEKNSGQKEKTSRKRFSTDQTKKSSEEKKQKTFIRIPLKRSVTDIPSELQNILTPPSNKQTIDPKSDNKGKE